MAVEKPKSSMIYTKGAQYARMGTSISVYDVIAWAMAVFGGADSADLPIPASSG
jgi:hypothetical protein